MTRVRILWIAVVCLASLSIGFVAAQWRSEDRDQSLPETPADLADQPRLNPAELEPGELFRITRTPDRWTRDGWLRFVPVPQEIPDLWEVWGRNYRFDALVVRGTGPVVILLPELAGSRRTAEYVARRFGRARYQIIAILPPDIALPPSAGEGDWIQLLRERVRAGRFALRLAREDLHATCRVVLGISVGGIAAVPVAVTEGDVEGVVLMLAGGDLSAIAEESREPSVQATYERRGGYTPTTLTPEALRSIDPLTWAPGLYREQVLFVRSLWDQVVPARASLRLWHALGRPATRVYPAGHTTFGAFLPFAMDAAIQHANTRCSTGAR